MKRILFLMLMVATWVSASAQTKKVSVLGDSYSTFIGVIPANYSSFYPNDRNGSGADLVEPLYEGQGLHIGEERLLGRHNHLRNGIRPHGHFTQQLYLACGQSG